MEKGGGVSKTYFHEIEEGQEKKLNSKGDDWDLAFEEKGEVIKKRKHCLNASVKQNGKKPRVRKFLNSTIIKGGVPAKRKKEGCLFSPLRRELKALGKRASRGGDRCRKKKKR